MSDSEKHDSEENGKRPPGDPFRTVASGGGAVNDPSTEFPQRIGRYRIERLIGVGSFGRIYLAHDPQLRRSVAIKAPHAHLIERSEDAGPYLHEAQTLARLDHPNIVPIYDVGSSEPVPFFIVSKFIDGTDLATKIQSQRLSFGQATELVATVAEALHYAHTQGFVHRDVKPANILLERDENPCLADFGLALRDEDVGKGSRFAGTPAYMSPEQARGEGHRVDGRSDIYSLGAVFYELLVGRRTFQTAAQVELLELTAHHEPKPPRQIDDRVPKELERICLKAVARRAADRYTTAKDLADDLRCFLAEHPTMAAETGPTHAPESLPQSSQHGDSSGAESHPLRVVPKGLRAFDAGDADFYLQLVPGPRDRHGLPDMVRFWKTKIEQRDADLTFPIGLIYGPSGCGKSSFMKAGLLPLLSDDMVVVYVESTATDTEQRLTTSLPKIIPDLPADRPLNELIAALRTNPALTHSRKTLIVLDQFEQWLHAIDDYESSLLAQTLRQCDGARVQCILMVRDDFWMAVTRLLHALEVQLVEGQNSSTVDLFPPRHARKVLAAFGRAFGDLPEEGQSFSASQKTFLSTAIDQLAEGGHVICVRLALFAEMMKGKQWEPATLQQTGGAEGVGVTFLEEAFAGPSAPPEHRYHQRAARQVLAALLPDPGTGIKGHMRSHHQLLAASGYGNRPEEFASLLRILDNQLRLITPTDPAGSDQPEDQSLAPTDRTDDSKKYYQLTHDYLINPLREWLTRKARETRRGRATLRLAERSAQWHRRPENRFLPNVWEHTFIRLLTRKRDWSESERKMMRRSSAVHGIRAALFALLAVAVGWVGYELYGSMRAHAIARQIATAQTGDLLDLVEGLEKYRRWANKPLSDMVRSKDPGVQWRGRVALLPVDGSQVDPLKENLLAARPEDVDVIRRALEPYAEEIGDELWQIVEHPDDHRPEAFLPAASALALYEPTSPRWEPAAVRVVRALVSENILHARTWTQTLAPIRAVLLDPLATIYRPQNSTYNSTQRDLATDILEVYAAGQFEVLVDLLLDGDPEQFVKLFDELSAFDERTIERCLADLDREQHYSWNDAPIDPSWQPASPDDVTAIAAATGMLNTRFALCQEMPLDRFKTLLATLRESGYRPVHVRPYHRDNDVLVAATWTRDQLDWRVAFDLTPPEILEKDSQLREEGYRIDDVAGYVSSDHELNPDRYCGVWVVQTPTSYETRLFLGASTGGFTDTIKPIDVQGFNRPVTFQSFRNSKDQQELCGIRSNGDFWTRLEINHSLDTYKEIEYLSMTQIDVDVIAPPDGCRYAGVWRTSRTLTAVQTHDVDPQENLEIGRRYAADGYRPVTMCAAHDPDADRIFTASVWNRPRVTEVEEDLFTWRQSNAALVLLRMQRPQEIWRLLQFTPNPSLRSYIVNRCSLVGVDPHTLADRLAVEEDIGIRRALVLCLGQYSVLPESLQESVIKRLLDVHAETADSGLHSAIEYSFRCWGRDKELDDIKDRRSQTRREAEANWFYTSLGQKMVMVPGPSKFLMGSSCTGNKWPTFPAYHTRLIPRTYAIGAMEVTVEQFHAFLQDVPNYYHFYTKRYSPQRTCPQGSVTWYDAAAFCRWLSEKEGVPEDQMCYPPIPEIKEKMTLRANSTQRTGYRLPTETEWEYACKANSLVNRHFGRSDVLLLQYAWCRENSQDCTWPVGRLMPNDLGLFDTLGNVAEWCHTPYQKYVHGKKGAVQTDQTAEDTVMLRNMSIITRGGDMTTGPGSMESAVRNGDYPGTRSYGIGFRLARTMPAE